jgi:hypothetical protein
MRIASKLLLSGSVALLTGVAGCSYSNSSSADPGYTWGSVYRQDVKTVAVPVFVTRSFFRGQEQQLTQALVNQIEARTPYKVTDRARADTIIEGEIVRVDITTVSQNADNALPQEQLYAVVIDFTWKDLRTGAVLVERRNFEQTVTYYPQLGDGRFVASQSAAEQLAAGIVEELQGNW